MKISIITPVYNAAKYLDKTYHSVISQLHKDWEWILIDDRSIDDSWSILKSFKEIDQRIKIFQNPTNSGPSFSRNFGLNNAAGEYIAFLDADDEWFPEKLGRQLEFMIKNKLNSSCHPYLAMDESGKVIKTIDVPPKATKNDLQAFNPLATSFMMVKKEAIGSLRFDLSLRRRQDWIFWFHLLEKSGDCLSLTETLGKYRKDSQHSISKNKMKMAQIQWRLYRNYFKLGLCQSVLSFTRYAFRGIKNHFTNY